MLPPIYTWLANDSAVTAQVSTRIYGSGIAPEKPEGNYIVWQQVGMVPEEFMNCPQNLDYDRVQVHAWSKSQTEAKALARACRDALEPHGYIVGGIVDDYDTEAKLYRCGFDFADWTDY